MLLKVDNVAKCNLGKVNLETMLASGLLSCVTQYAGVPMGWQGLHVLCGFVLIVAEHCLLSCFG